jgi:hypothetical protein
MLKQPLILESAGSYNRYVKTTINPEVSWKFKIYILSIKKQEACL